jgi:hypothetical protein
MIECVEKEPVIIAVYDGFWGSQGYLLPVDSFAITCQLCIDSGKIERELLIFHLKLEIIIAKHRTSLLLSSDEHTFLLDFTRKGLHPARAIKRCPLHTS